MLETRSVSELFLRFLEYSHVLKKSHLRASERAQGVKVLAAEPGYPSSNPRTHIKGDTELTPQRCPTYMLKQVHAWSYPHTNK